MWGHTSAMYVGTYIDVGGKRKLMYVGTYFNACGYIHSLFSVQIVWCLCSLSGAIEWHPLHEIRGAFCCCLLVLFVNLGV